MLNPDSPEQKTLKSKGLEYLKKDDVVSIRTPGAGGYGKPSDRDKNSMLADVKDGKVSLKNSQKDYGS